MADVNVITGVVEVLKNIETRTKEMGAGVSRGLRLAGLRLQRESQKKVPVNFGVLKNSAFTRKEGESFKTVVTVGYTASYAIFVHEAVGMKLKGQPRPGGKGKYWDPQGRAQAKFLEEPARTLRDEMRRIIASQVRIPGLGI